MSSRRYRRHERFDAKVATDPASQVEIEGARRDERDFILDCLDLIEGRQTVGARRADAERKRLLKLASEAKRRALVGADPLNLTGHTRKAPRRQKLAVAPVEYIGMIARTVSALDRIVGKNKLDRRQALAADTYRDAFETTHASLGGSMDFSRIRSSSAGVCISEAALMASQKLTQAKGIVGVRAVVILEQVVCHGHTIAECARQLYGHRDGDTASSRDVNHVGRVLRESLTELGKVWHPDRETRRMRSFVTERSMPGAEGVHNVAATSYVSR